MPGRPHAERLRQSLNEIRAELIQTVHEIPPEAFEQAPGPGMKSPKQQLQEIGAMEGISIRWVTGREMSDWNALWDSFDKENAEATLAALEASRAETLGYLTNCTEEDLETPISLPEVWYEYFGGATEIEPEELLRWIAQHEYYHLGQLITYGFLRAQSPQSTA